jgi:7-cyano-7-deazaguanine synthase in queuosine biosynthesis
MCGIVGTISVGNTGVNQIGIIMPNIKYRGRDFFGFSFQDNTGAVHTTKDQDLTNLLQQFAIQTNMIPIKWAMANARAIPEPEWIEHPDGAKETDCQPAESDNFVCVLNGCISNDKELRKKYKLEVESTVDTFVIPALLEFYIDKGLSPDNAVSNTVMELEGSFACIIAHKNTNTFYVLSNFVPLYTVYDPVNQIYYFASMPEWFEVLKGCTYPQSIAPYKMCKIQPGKKLQTTSILKTQSNNRMLCICSSGMDSLTTARLYQCLGYEVELLHFDYGCAASEKEIENIQRASQLMNMKLRILDAKTIFDMFKNKSRLLTDDKTLNDGATWLADAESVTESQMVFVKNGRNVECVKIGEFIDKLLKENARNVESTYTGEKLKLTNIETLSFNEINKKYEWKKIHTIFRHRPTSDIYKIIGRRGMDLEITGEHSIYKFDRKTGNMILTNAKNLKPGDSIYSIKNIDDGEDSDLIVLDIAKILSNYPRRSRLWIKYDETKVWTTFSRKEKITSPRFIPLDSDFAFVLGAWAAEGGDKCWSVKNEEFANMFLDKLNKVFHSEIKIRKNYCKEYNNYNYDVTVSVVVERLFELLVGRGCRSKTIPNEIFSSSKQIQWEFIRGLWYGDGSVDISRGYNYADLNTTSKEMRLRLSTLLKWLGCSVSVTFDKSQKEGWSDVWEIILCDSKSYNLLAQKCGYVKSNNIYDLKIPVASDWVDKVGEKYLFGDNPTPNCTSIKNLKKHSDKLYKEFKDFPLDFIEITKIEKIEYNHYVYDFGVEDNENFFINDGYLVHNSTISYVPARNAIFAMLGASIAEQEGFTYISQGLNLIDSVYPDNQLTYLTKVNELMPYALNWNSNVQFKAPLVHLTKREILQIALHIGVPLQSSWSCYKGKKKRCGDCGPDKFRMYAFQRLGYKDFVEYEKVPEDFWKDCVDIPKHELNLMLNPRVKLPNPKEHPLWEYIRKEI